MARNSKSFRVGRVRGDLRGRVWYLSYSDQGQRHRPRVGSDRNAARQLAAKINAELEAGVTTTLAFQAIRFSELRQQRLQFHEQIARSSVASISRSRAPASLSLLFGVGAMPVIVSGQLVDWLDGRTIGRVLTGDLPPWYP